MQLSLSIDVGGTKCAVGLVTREGELIDRTSVLVNPRDTAEDLFSDIAEAVQQQLARAREHHGESPLTVGVACAGPSTHNLESVSPLYLVALTLVQTLTLTLTLTLSLTLTP